MKPNKTGAQTAPHIAIDLYIIFGIFFETIHVHSVMIMRGYYDYSNLLVYIHTYMVERLPFHYVKGSHFVCG